MISGSTVFRRMDSNDMAAMMNVERAAFALPWSARMMRDSADAAHTQVWGLFTDDTLVAFMVFAMILDEAELLSMAVHPDYQRQGYGAALLEAVIARLQRKRVEKLHLEVRASNEAALHLYNKYGFERVGLRKAYYPTTVEGQREDAVLMSLVLNETPTAQSCVS